MFEAPFNWSSFWDLATPEEAAITFRELYGASAAQAAAQCANAASKDNRESDHRFWLAVCAALSDAGSTASVPPGSLPH